MWELQTFGNVISVLRHFLSEVAILFTIFKERKILARTVQCEKCHFQGKYEYFNFILG